MRELARLFEELDATTSTQAKVDAMARYFASAPKEDVAWALFFLTGQRLKRTMPVRLLASWAIEIAGIPEWLFEECYGAVGDLAEVCALLVEGREVVVPLEVGGASKDRRAVRDLFAQVEAFVPPTTLAEHARAIQALRDLGEDAQKARVLAMWKSLDRTGVMLLTKMLTGELRVGASALLATRALAKASGVPQNVLAHRMMGGWEPSAAVIERFVAPASIEEDPARPYPFALASQLEGAPESVLGDRAQWIAEPKWDGIRCQLVRRAGGVWAWSRGEELVTDRFPEIVDAARAIADGTVLDGEVLAWRGERPLPFSVMQRRIGRKVLGEEVLAEAPVVLVAYDLLEERGEDLRELAMEERRARLERVIAGAGDARLRISPIVEAATWAELAAVRARSRERGVEGLMLKRRDARYRGGRRRGEFWKWKIDPYALDCVLVYAQPGSGRRSNLFTDYTFAVWDGAELVPIAKAYSGLDDAEIAELDRWVRAHTVDRHGPVRVVEPVQVLELGFEGIAASGRHKSGIALRFPRMLRWRKDKRAEYADTIASVRALLRIAEGGGGEEAGEGEEAGGAKEGGGAGV